jgi:hypothetical protein
MFLVLQILVVIMKSLWRRTPKAQLEKGLATCVQGGKSLDALLEKQRVNDGTEVLGFVAKTKKKKNKKKKKKKNKGVVQNTQAILSNSK